MTNPVSPIPSNHPQHRPVLSRFHLQAEQARQRFQVFVQQAWHVLEPQTPFISGIHFEAMCEHLQAVTEGRIKNLIINVPPGHAKSLLTAVFWPAWVWISHPETRWLFSGYREDLATRDSVRCRRLSNRTGISAAGETAIDFARIKTRRGVLKTRLRGTV
jgi:hypothetical protein